MFWKYFYICYIYEYGLYDDINVVFFRIVKIFGKGGIWYENINKIRILKKKEKKKKKFEIIKYM